jgi:3',5'-cyclic AMP phosphodiesterase CpdA
MRSPFLIVQLSDPHIGAGWADGDPAERLAAAVESVCSMRPHPDALLVSGDLADAGADEGLRQLASAAHMSRGARESDLRSVGWLRSGMPF